MVVGSSFVDRNSTVAHSTRGANSGTRYGTSRVVLGLSIVVECCSGQPFALPRRLALTARNLNSGLLVAGCNLNSGEEPNEIVVD